MRGTRPQNLPPASRSAPGDRVCAEPGCGTELSVYNTGARCWQHSDVVFPTFRGKRLRRPTRD